MKKMKLQDQGNIILLRTSGKGHDDRSAQTMKSLRIKRPRAHGGKRPPELAHRHFGHPEGGSLIFSKWSQGLFLKKWTFISTRGTS